MIKEENFSLPSKDGRTMLHGVYWIPEGEVTAVVQICHGMSEYIERYREFAEYLAQRGILVAGHDHLGHGGSVVSTEDYGYFAKEHGNKILVRDIHSVYKRTREQYPDVPYLMFGHSMGSFLARQYLCRFGEGLDGAVICGTGYQPEALLKAGMALSRLEASLLGWHYRSNLFWKIAFGDFNRKFHPARTEADWLCGNEETVDKYLSDPKCNFRFTLNGYYNLFLGMLKIEEQEYLSRMPKDLPVLFVSGGRDPVGNFGKGVRKVVSLFLEKGMKRVECRIYPESRHEILNEKNREEVCADLYGWMEQIWNA